MPTLEKTRTVVFQKGLSAGSVNADGFSELSLITAGVEAAGHGMFVDEKGVQGLAKLLLGKTLKSYLTHAGAGYTDRLGQEVGLFSGIYLDTETNKLKAKQFKFLNSFKKYNAEAHEKLVELADKVPDDMGLSVVFEGSTVWVDAEGNETDSDEMMPEGCQYGMPCVRFSAIDSADWVGSPAANPDGLLAKPVDAPAKGMAQTIDLELHTAVLFAKDAELVTLSASHKSALEKLTADHVAALAAKDDSHKTELSAKDAEIVTIKADHAKQIEASEKALADSKAFDARLLGVPEAVILASRMGDSAELAVALPEPAAGDPARWAQHAELKAKSPKVAAEFRAKYLGATRTK